MKFISDTVRSLMPTEPKWDFDTQGYIESLRQQELAKARAKAKQEHDEWVARRERRRKRQDAQRSTPQAELQSYYSGNGFPLFYD